MTPTTTKIKEIFLKDVKDHQIEILKDDDVYRHIRLRNPKDICYYYDIITFPSGLLFTGDMQTYEFERTIDMFAFFRSGIDKDGDININIDYWAEKCQAMSIYCKIKNFFETEFFKNIDSYFACYYEIENMLLYKLYHKMEYEDKGSIWFNSEGIIPHDIVWHEIQEHFEYIDHHEYSLYSAVNTFKSDTSNFDFQDFFEYDCSEYDYNFIWCLFAIVYAIREYDKLKESK